MSEIEQIDFSTLIWVKKELDETLSRAQSAIEAYVENPEDENQLQFCATYLHQVQGTLKMVELYGAAMVAEEMEQVATKILDKEVDSEKDAFEVLTRGILLLPDYLERIQLGHKDIPMVLLPLVNDLRTVKGDQLLSESALFNPDLNLGIPESSFNSSFVLGKGQLTQVVNKIRSVYQMCLLNWLKGVDVDDNLKKIQVIVDKLKTVVLEDDEKQMFWVAGGLFEALINGGLERSVTVKQLSARLDQAIRTIVSASDADLERPFKKITKNLLYYVALAKGNDRRTKEIQTFFNLSRFISDETEIEKAQSSLSGKNKELLESVTSVIKEDLMTVQENLDLYNRNEKAEIADMDVILASLNKISDTLGIIGVGSARSKIKTVVENIELEIKESSDVSKNAIMKIAETILFVNIALDENIHSLGETKNSDDDSESSIPSSEIRKIRDTLAQESINSLQKVKQNFIHYIESSWDQECLQTSPELLSQIGGALKMSGFIEVSEEIEKIERYTTEVMLKSGYVPKVENLDLLAEAIASLEYYLEYLSEGTKGASSILQLAKSNIEKLSLSSSNSEVKVENDVEDESSTTKDSVIENKIESIEKLDHKKDELVKLSENVELNSDDQINSDLDSLDEFEFDDEIENEANSNSTSVEVEELLVSFNEDTEDDIKEVFLEEFEEELEHLESIHPRWKSNPEEQFELLGEIRRIYHTLKGSGRLVGAMAIGDFSWKIEDMTNQVLNKTKEVSSSYLLVMDASKNLLPGLYEALKNETVVPKGYYAVLNAAEEVIAGNEVTEIVIEESSKDESEALTIEQESEDNNITIADSNTSELNFGDDLINEDISLDDEFDFDDELMELDDLSEDSDLSVDPVFVEILQQEVEGHLSDVNEYLISIEKSDNNIPTEKFIRIIHTLNGAANMASVNSIVSMTTPLELYAKELMESKQGFSEDCIRSIEDFKNESEKIMIDLSQNSNPNDKTNEIGAYFKNATIKLNEETVIEPDNSADDLTQYIDGSINVDTDTSVDKLESKIQNVSDNNVLMEEFNAVELEIDELISQDDSNSDENEIKEDLIIESDDLDLEAAEAGEELDIQIDDIELEEAGISEELDLQIDNIELEEFEVDEELEMHVDDFESDELEEELDNNTTDLEGAEIEEEIDLQIDENALDEHETNEELESSGFELEEDESLVVKSESDEIELEEIDLDLSDTLKEDELEIEELNFIDDSEENDNLSESNLEVDELSDDEGINLENSEKIESEEIVLEDKLSEDNEITLDLEQSDEELNEQKSAIDLDSIHVPASVQTSYDEQTESSEQESSDEFDDELLEIFKEEADDILDRTEHVLSELEEDPNNFKLIEALQRDLHTLKGGSRMAGLNNIGDLSHVLESLLEKIGEEKGEIDTQTIGIIHDSFDTLNKLKNENDFGQSIEIDTSVEKVKSLLNLSDAIIPEKSKLDIDEFAPIDPMDSAIEEQEDNTEQQTTAAQTKKSNVLSGNQIKVNSELLDNLVNYAGEVSIYRSRLEQEVGSFSINLVELGNTVSRIREQLRKLDVETEAQIISTFQTEENDEGFDPLEMDRFSQLQQLSRSLTESVSDLTSIHSYLDDVARKSDNLLTQQSRVNAELQDGLMETRLVSFNSIVPRLRRLVRTTAKELDKPVKLDVHGAEGEMDKTVLEGVIAPLEHMIRNALAHGIEEDRKGAKKDDTGHISLDLKREATEVVITVIDDGAGINRDKVKQIAIDKGILDKKKQINPEDIDRLILHSGFSTVDTVSKIAGRGVGMDVVVNQINLLGGSLDISSEFGKGTKFTIRLPYTLALSNALLVEVAEQVYAVPISGLEGVIRMSYSDYLQRVKDGNMVYNYANEEYQIYELNNLLDIESEVLVENNQIPLVMIRSGEHGVALRVDNVLGSREIVVKNVGAQIFSVPGIFGATILGDGNVVLILDVIPLSRSYEQKLKVREESGYVAEEIETTRDPIVMIVDDSITMRKVGERILRRNDYDVVTAKDGIDALDQLKEVVPDVMLLDIEMPRMDGYELAIEMKKIENYAKVPIIMITSRTGEKHRQKAMDLGVNRYLGKPYQEADLLENISELIEEFKQ